LFERREKHSFPAEEDVKHAYGSGRERKGGDEDASKYENLREQFKEKHVCVGTGRAMGW